jgi:hypothetical protein
MLATSRKGATSAMGQKQTSDSECSMSAFPPIADITGCEREVRFVPKPDSCAATALSFDHLVGAGN